MRRIRSIQYWRAVAAMMVVVYHAFSRAGNEPLFMLGSAGVDIFFVISGTLMLIVTDDLRQTPAVFLWHRLARIVPLYWAVTLLYVAIGLIAPALYPWPAIRADEIVRSLLFVPYQSQGGPIVPVVAPGWSLNMEMFFYALLALAIVVDRKRRLTIAAATLVAVVALEAAAGGRLGPLVTFYGSGITLDFLAGLVLGRLWLDGRIPGFRTGVAILALSVAALAATLVAGIHPEGLPRFLLWGLPACGLLLGGLAIERSDRLPDLKLMETLGDASYSLYLLHTLVIAVSFRFTGERPFLLLAIAAPVAAALSVVSYRLFERPLDRFLRSGTRRHGTAQMATARVSRGEGDGVSL